MEDEDLVVEDERRKTKNGSLIGEKDGLLVLDDIRQAGSSSSGHLQDEMARHVNQQLDEFKKKLSQELFHAMVSGSKEITSENLQECRSPG